jgi:hypothetical protein
MTTRPQPQIFVVRLEAAPGEDGVRRLRWVLKELGRRHGLKAISVEQQKERRNPDDAQAKLT